MKICHCCNGKDLENKYVKPQKYAKEIVLLVDDKDNVGVLGLENRTLVMNNQGLNIIYDMFLNENVSSLSKINEDYSEANNWLYPLVNDSVFEITDKRPERKVISDYEIKKGDSINPQSIIKVVKADCDGNVKEIKIDDTKIYIFRAKEEIDVDYDENATSVLIDKGDSKTTLYPKVNSNLNIKKTLARKSGCTACVACSACGACILCGEINFGAGAAATTASAYVIHVS